jgi:hypothetical protein
MEQLSEQEENHIQNLQLARSQAKQENKNRQRLVPGKQKADFPILLFFTALTKDTLDIIPFVGFVTTPFFWLIVFIWFLNKDPIKKKALSKSKMMIGGSSSFIIGMVPIIKIVPETSIFVWFVYKNEKKALKRRHKFIPKK